MILRYRLLAILIGVATGVSVLLAGLSPASGAAQASATYWTTVLGPIGFGAIVADDARNQVLVSGRSGNVVKILDDSGKLVTTVPNIYGAAGMVIQRDQLYVAESTAGAIVRIDLTNPANPPVTVANGLYRPYWLVETGGKLWTADNSGHLISVKPSTGAVSVFTSFTFIGADLATSPGDLDTLFVAVDGSDGPIYRLDVSSRTPKVVASGSAGQ
ncbi:MAG TPA: hypothetical protein VFZ25_10365 [Chloroflexota bacterium]|nr:hypothetical protein [Chloroflexota bacterium]